MDEKLKESIIFTLISILGGLLPIILFWLAYSMEVNEWQKLKFLTDRGDFLLICTSLLISSIYSLIISKKPEGYGEIKIIVIIISVAICVFAACVYGFILSDLNLSEIGSNVAKILSIIGISWCLIPIFCSRYFWDYTPKTNIPGESNKRLKDKQKRLEKVYKIIN